jgi:hypothetical protein
MNYFYGNEFFLNVDCKPSGNVLILFNGMGIYSFYESYIRIAEFSVLFDDIGGTSLLFGEF